MDENLELFFDYKALEEDVNRSAIALRNKESERDFVKGQLVTKLADHNTRARMLNHAKATGDLREFEIEELERLHATWDSIDLEELDDAINSFFKGCLTTKQEVNKGFQELYGILRQRERR